MQKVLSAIRNLAPSSSTHQTISGKSVAVTADDWAQKYKIKVVSFNNFPTAAGLASSASGYCCLGKPCFKKIGKHLSLFSYQPYVSSIEKKKVFALAQLIGIKGDITPIARLGSGSACRSLFGGFVKWNVGSREDGIDSNAVQVSNQSARSKNFLKSNCKFFFLFVFSTKKKVETEMHWPELEILILVVIFEFQNTNKQRYKQF